MMKQQRIVWLLVVCVLAGLLARGAAAQESRDVLEIRLASPGQSEIFYAAPTGVLTSVPVSGQVVSYEVPVDLETVELTLTFFDEAGNAVETRTPVEEDGHFFAWVTINPRSILPTMEIHEEDICLSCHTFGEIDMPLNVSRLLVHARTPDGLTGSTMRDIRLDRGVFQPLEVQVEGLPADSQAAQVMANTIVYEWRPRIFYGRVVDGRAHVEVEQLTHADLDYEITFPPVVIDAVRYEAEPQTLTLPAAGGAIPSVTLHVRPVLGTIAGRVALAGDRAGVAAATLRVVDLLTGAGQTVVTDEDGAFLLDELPVSEYVMQAQSSAGVHLPGRYDLREDIAPEAAVYLVRGGPDVLQGQAVLDGVPLPFARAAVEGLLAAPADPLTGAFAVAAVPADEAVEVTVMAPGCYSVRQAVTDRDMGTVALALHPTTTVLDQDGARLYLPAETRATHADGEVRLEQGVLWVNSEPAADHAGFTVIAGDYRLSGAGASYAVEALTGALPRLYVRAGVVTAVRGEEEPLRISAGETLTLSGDAAQPVALVEGAGVLLRTVGGEVGRFELQPPLSDRVGAALWQVLEGAAQVLMLGAYAITFIGFPLFIVGGIIMQVRRR